MFYKQFKIDNFWDFGIQNNFLPEKQKYAKVQTKLFIVILTN